MSKHIKQNDQYYIGFWTEYKGSSNDDYYVNKSIDFKGADRDFSEMVSSAGVDYSVPLSISIGTVVDPNPPNNYRFRVGSKAFGFLDGDNAQLDSFEEENKNKIFTLRRYQDLLNFRNQNPQRFMVLNNNATFTKNGKSVGKPLIIDSLVPQPPDYILSLEGKLSSQWNYDKLFKSKTFPVYPRTIENNFFGFQKTPFREWSPFVYNFTDEFVNMMWTSIKLSESAVVAIVNLDKYVELKQWFQNENEELLPIGNHLGKTLLPYTSSIDFISSGSYSPADQQTLYLINSTDKGPVHIGLGRCNLIEDYNVASYYFEATNSVTSLAFGMDIFSQSSYDYFDNTGSGRSYIFHNPGFQNNLNEEWLYSFPNEYRFKNVVRQSNPRRLGSLSWGVYDNAKYSVQGWEIPQDLMEIDNLGSVNDLKMGTMFWKFDHGAMQNRYLGSNILSANIASEFVAISTASDSSFRYIGKKPEILYGVDEQNQGRLLSPTIVLADFYGTPKTKLYNWQLQTSNSLVNESFNLDAQYQLFPRLRDMLNNDELTLQFSLSFNQTYPEIQDLYKSFYGFGDGVTTQLSEYCNLSTSFASVKVENIQIGVDEEENPIFNEVVYAHRKPVTWGRDKIPSFKFGYQYLHTMTYSVAPTPLIEEPVSWYATASYSGQDGFKPREPGVFIVTQSYGDFTLPEWPTENGSQRPTHARPLWWEGPYVVSGPVLRGYKFGLYDCLPRVSRAVYMRDKFGQMRHMLEQRKLYATRYSDTNEEIFVVDTQYVSGSFAEQVWKNYNEWQPGDQEPLNFMDSGIYEKHNRVGKPFNDSGWV